MRQGARLNYTGIDNETIREFITRKLKRIYNKKIKWKIRIQSLGS
jgi:hypothetical protein